MKDQNLSPQIKNREIMFKQINYNLPEISELKKYTDLVAAAQKDLIAELNSGAIAPLNIAYETADCDEIQKLAAKITKKFQKVLILGVGGSSLGGKTLNAIKNNCQIKIDFLESIDCQTIKNKIKETDLENTFFIVISKSGETIETTCQTLIFIDQFYQAGIKDLAHNFLFITQDLENKIAEIAKEIKAPIYHHPENIGGRFSYLTIVGLLPAALAGLDLKAIRNGARKILDNFISKPQEENNIFQSCARQLYLIDCGFSHNVVMPYIDSLKDFTDWYRQLWAESLGKIGFGSTPINSMGTIDQHSQLQLYLEGPRDKYFTFITNKNYQSDIVIKDLEGCKTRFGGINLEKIIAIEQNTTIEALNVKKAPIRVIELNELCEEALSGLMMQMFIETIIIAKIKNINPFDQPGVELRKELTKKYL
jgi:glucose-6-phosphate isomerase